MQGEVQQFASAPQAVGTRKKYRDPADTAFDDSRNLMHDRRVVRGNTYAGIATQQQSLAEVQKQREAQRRRLQRAGQTKKQRLAGASDTQRGKKHTDIQTDAYLEELTDRTVDFEAETHTDFLLDRPPSPLFMPAKIGCDIETQVEDGELFNFDVECEPVLEVIVGKTLEQSMLEVLEEEELETLRRHQEEFQRRRNVEVLEVQRIELAEKRKQDEIERRQQQQAMRKEMDMAMMRKVVSRTMAAAHLSSLRERVLAQFCDAGGFSDPVELAVENNFAPALLESVLDQMGHKHQDQVILGDVMRSALTKQEERHSKALEVERRRLRRIDDAERQARAEKAEEQEQRKREIDMIAEEQQAMVEWDAYIPDPPEPEVQELEVTSFDPETLIAKLGDQDARAPAERADELLVMLDSLQPGERVMAKFSEPVPNPEPVTIDDFYRAGAGPGDEDAAAGSAVDDETTS